MGEHAHIINEALDLYIRIGLGQIGSISNHLHHFNPCSYEISRLIESIKPDAIRLGCGCSLGITSKELPDRFRVACDILECLRNKVAWSEHPEGGFGTQFQEPFHWSKQTPQIVVKETLSG